MMLAPKGPYCRGLRYLRVWASIITPLWQGVMNRPESWNMSKAELGLHGNTGEPHASLRETVFKDYRTVTILVYWLHTISQ